MRRSLNYCIPLVAFILMTGCWTDVDQKPENLQILFFLGDVNINGKVAVLNQVVEDGSIIETGPQSLAEFKIEGRGGFQVRENGRVEIKRDDKGWASKVERGAVLSLLRPGTSYRLTGTAAVMAVRGTIFYTHCYDDSTQYTCTCNGTVELSEDGSFLRKVTASHHEPYLIRKTGAGPEVEPAPMKEHDDVQIFEFMYRLERND